jgi:S-methylmethionine-dependent homocysteine/selenocysteine methylase
MGEQISIIILDGAMGTELARRGVDTGLPLWSANALLSAPDEVRQIHADYIRAGARVITADTFRTNVRTLARAGLRDRARELTFKAVELAREATMMVTTPRKGRVANSPYKTLVAGSMAPVEDCYSPELVPGDEGVLLSEHAELARNLADAGCDLLLIETMNTIREAVAAARAAAATGLPHWSSFMLRPDNHLPSGECLADAVRAVLPFGPRAVLVNCIPVAQVQSALELLREAVGGAGILLGAYGNAGHVEEDGWTLRHAVSPPEYAQAALEWRRAGACIIGGCCGTQPAHIRTLTAALAPMARGSTPMQHR